MKVSNYDGTGTYDLEINETCLTLAEVTKRVPSVKFYSPKDFADSQAATPGTTWNPHVYANSLEELGYKIMATDEGTYDYLSKDGVLFDSVKWG